MATRTLKNLLRPLLGKALRALPEGPRYRVNTALEKYRYNRTPEVHDLPPIFHYWSHTYVRPMLEHFGFANPDDFFVTAALAATAPGEHYRLLSIGSGHCELEVAVAEALAGAGVDFTLDCIDLNPKMLGRGAQAARGADVAHRMQFVQADFNRWRPEHAYDLAIANQSLHHVLELEHLFDAIKAALKPNGQFLISDMIGRNGHQRWPEAEAIVQQHWSRLDARYLRNCQTGRIERTFINRDYSAHGFEGIRAQDILPLLIERFEFHTFIPYGNVVFPFIERTIGPNFDANDPDDRAFIDRLHAIDEQGFRDGSLSPTSMVAIAGHGPYETRLRDERLTPKWCVRSAQ